MCIWGNIYILNLLQSVLLKFHLFDDTNLTKWKKYINTFNLQTHGMPACITLVFSDNLLSELLNDESKDTTRQDVTSSQKKNSHSLLEGKFQRNVYYLRCCIIQLYILLCYSICRNFRISLAIQKDSTECYVKLRTLLEGVCVI